MDYFQYQQNQLYAESVDLKYIADHYGTPCYVYSRATLERHWYAFEQALQGRKHLICYAVKANSNLSILKILATLGAGFDIVSIGELERVLKAGGDPAKVVFSGVGKSARELRRALDVGIHCFNVESVAELQRLNQIAAEMDKSAPVSLRVNPDVDAKTHPYISTGLKENKFGIPAEQVIAVYQQAAELSHIDIVGIDCHIGSQLLDIAPFIDALQRVLDIVAQLKTLGIELQHIDIGGGLGVCYQNEQTIEPADYINAVTELLADQDYQLIIEPGRALVANAGILLTEIEYLKPASTEDGKHFAVVDAAMNDLLRPALYQSWQDIIPLDSSDKSITAHNYDIVGPICETGDFLGKDRQLSLQAGDRLAIRSCGAYGFTMSSQYNSRPRAAEVMVEGYHHRLIRKREVLSDLWQHELDVL